MQQKQKRERLNLTIMNQSHNKFIISCNNPWRKRWSYLIIIIAIYSVVFIPMRVAVHTTVLDPVYAPLDVFTYILYILDVVINIRTTYMNSFGEEIFSTKKIFWHYAGSMGFWIDLLSLLNYPGSTSWVLNMIGILKVNRVLRIYTLIN